MTLTTMFKKQHGSSLGGMSRFLPVLPKVMLCAVGVLLNVSATASPSIYPTGTTRYDPAKAFNSFVLFTAGDNIAHLIDLNGNSVHEWKDAASHSTLIDPAVNGGKLGHVFVTLDTIEGRGTDLVPGQVNRKISKTVGELDWDGKAVWTFGEKAPGGAAQQHHDWARLPNGNTIVLANLVHSVKGFKQPQVLDDVIYEVNPAREVVWKWIASEHINEFGFSKQELKLVRNAEIVDYLHVNNLKVVGSNHWFAAGDKRFDPDNLLFDARNANFIAIIDKKTGKIAWRLGPHYKAASEEQAQPRNVPRPVDQISAQHDAHIIPEGLPGAGNLLVFDNQGLAGYPTAAVPGYWKSIRSRTRWSGSTPARIPAVPAGHFEAPISALPDACPTAIPLSMKAKAAGCSR